MIRSPTLLLAALVGCGTADATPAPSAAGWIATAADGSVVRVLPDALPVNAGPTQFRIELPHAAEDVRPTVDLVSPTMLSHGVTRYAARSDGPGAWVANVEIPMAGAWLLYVNLDQGATSVPFAFDAVGGAGHEHHGAQHAPAPAHGGNHSNPRRQ